MLASCIAIMAWQASVFYRANSEIGYYITLLEAVFVGCSSYMVWRYGGIAEAVTKVLEVTRIWDRSDSASTKRADDTLTVTPQHLTEAEPSMAVCKHCGFQMLQSAKFCRRCGTRRSSELNNLG
jgi:ribosomal protein L40E